MFRINKTFPALLLGLAFMAGCETLGLGGDDESTTRDDRVSRRDRISTDDPTGRNRGGFEMKYPSDFDNGIPTGARLVREADEDQQVNFKAAHDGRLHVYDVDSRRVTWSGQMRDGEAFMMDPRDDRATLEGRSVNARLNRDHRYRLYFVEEGVSSRNDRDRDSGVIDDR